VGKTEGVGVAYVVGRMGRMCVTDTSGTFLQSHPSLSHPHLALLFFFLLFKDYKLT